MTTKNLALKTTGAAAGVLLVSGLVAAPALAEYPYTGTGGNQEAATVATPAKTATGSQTPAFTGANTTLGLLTGLAVVGAGTGLVIAARRRRTD